MIATSFSVVSALTIGGAAAVVTLAAASERQPLPPRPATALAEASTPDDHSPGPAGGVKAVVVKSWGNCGSGSLVWDDMNRNWSRFGNTPLHIDYSDPDLCAGHLSYDALVASGAQTVVVSDPDLQQSQFSDDEIEALTRYAQEGHNLVGTFLLLHWGHVDNRGLAPLFGLDPHARYSYETVVGNQFQYRARVPLFKGLEGGDYTTAGYLASQEPQGRHWSPSEAGGAKVVAYDRGHKAAILSYCGSTYRALYFTWMPEYGGNAEDEQVLYNAMVSGLRPGCGD